MNSTWCARWEVLEKPGSLGQYYKYEPDLYDDDTIDFAANNTNDLFNFNAKIKDKTGDEGTRNIEVTVALK